MKACKCNACGTNQCKCGRNNGGKGVVCSKCGKMPCVCNNKGPKK